MKILTARDCDALSANVPGPSGQLHAHWIEGPHNADQLDVGVVTFSSNGATPPHTHVGGQVLIVTAGRGFVEANGVRQIVEPGDVVVCPPDELHTHGALDGESFAHVTVTTGGYVMGA